MKPPSALLILLILATVLADVVLLLGVSSEVLTNIYGDIFVAAVVFGQVSLLSIWVGIGSTAWPLRLVVALVAILAGSALWMGELFDPDMVDLVALISVGMLAIAILATFARLAGFRWFGSTHVQESAAKSERHRGLQFSLASIFWLTTLVAVFVVMIRFLPLPLALVTYFLLFLFTNLAIAAGATSVIFASRHRLGRFAMLLVAAAVTGVVIYQIYPNEHLHFFISYYICSALFLTGWLEAARLGGARIVRLGRDAPSD